MTWMDRTRRTSFRATAGGLAMGWLTMTALLTAWSVATAAVKDLTNAFVGWPILFGFVGFVCLLGMAVISPVWWLGHRIGLRTRASAMALGALAGGLAGFALNRLRLALPEFRDDREYELAVGHEVPLLAVEDGHLTIAGWLMMVQETVPIIIASVVAAAVIWRVAYGSRSTTARPRPIADQDSVGRLRT